MNTITETPTSWNLAVEILTSDLETLGGWIESASTERQQSSYFGPISNAELVKLMFSGKCSGEQLQHCVTTLRTRIIAEHCELIALEATKIEEEMK